MPEPLSLLSLVLETKGTEHRLRVILPGAHGVSVAHQWRFTAHTLSAGIVHEVGTVMADETVMGLLRAVGIQGELAYELLEAAERL